MEAEGCAGAILFWRLTRARSTRAIKWIDELMTGVAPMLMTVADAGRALAVDTRTVRRMLARGDLAPVRIGRAVRVSVADLAAYVARQTGRADTGPETGTTETELPCRERDDATRTASTSGRTRRAGGPATRTPAAGRLADLLAFAPTRTQTGAGRARSGRDGSPKGRR